MTLKLGYAVIHELVKEQHKTPEKNKYGKKVLNVKNNIVQKLVSDIVDLYGKKDNLSQFGVFLEGSKRGKFPDRFISYKMLKSNKVNENEFMDVTIKAMESLRIKAMNESGSSGGYILFADYYHLKNRFFLIAMIKQRSGFSVNDDMEPVELIELDLSKLHQAARINFNKLTKYLSANEEEKQELKYLSFVSPVRNKATSGYFIKALGCSEGIASSIATRNLIKHSSDFFKENEALKQYSFELKEQLLEYLDNHDRAKLNEIEALVLRLITPENSEQIKKAAQDYINHLNSDGIEIPSEFPVHKATKDRYSQIRFKSDNWSIKFDRSSLGQDENSEIYYDSVNENLILSELDKKLVSMIQEELSARTVKDD